MKRICLVPILLLAVGACHTSGPPPRASDHDDALLLEVSAAERANIAEARLACDRAKDAHAAAQADRQKMLDEQTHAKKDADTAAANLAAAESALVTAVDRGTTAEIESAKKRVRVAKDEQEVQTAQETLRDTRTVHSTTLAQVAKEHVKVTEAQVELTKAKAVNTLDRPGSQKPDIAKFEQSLRRAEAGENVARVKSEAAQKEVDVTTIRLKDLQAAITR
jgi:hypothetical protein